MGGVVLQTLQLIGNYEGVASYSSKCWDLQNMKSIFYFHCFMLFQKRTVYAAIHIVALVRIVGANKTLVEPTYNTEAAKPGSSLSKNIIYKIRHIYIYIYIFRAKKRH